MLLLSLLSISPLPAMASFQIRRLQTENRFLRTENGRLQAENDRLDSENRFFRTERGFPHEREEEANFHFWPENCYFPFEEAFPTTVEKRAKKEVEKRAEKEEELGEDEADGLRSENRRFKAENAFLLKEAEKVAAAAQFHFEYESAFLKKEDKVAKKAIRERNEMREALQLAKAEVESLRLELAEKKKSDDADEKFARLVEARIARDKAVGKMEDCMAYSKYLEERLGRQERAVQVVCGRARRMLERVKKLAEDNAGEAEAPEKVVEEADEKWIRVLMRPLEEGMEKIESSFSKRS